jgi:hypothetical protein
MNEFNIKPSEVKALYQIIESIQKGGLDYSDVLKLIQKRTHPQMSLKNIKNVINAIKTLETNIIRNQKRG